MTATGKKGGVQLTFWCSCRTDWNRMTGELIEPRPCAYHAPVYGESPVVQWFRQQWGGEMRRQPPVMNVTSIPPSGDVVAREIDDLGNAADHHGSEVARAFLDAVDRLQPCDRAEYVPTSSIAAATIDHDQVAHELAVLRPRRGDVVVLYVADDTTQLRAGILGDDLISELRRAGLEGVACFILPRNARLQTLSAGDLDALGLQRKGR